MIRISDDSSTESDAGLDSDFHSSPESLADDDVVIVDTVGLPADNRGEAHGPQLPHFADGGHGFSSEGQSVAVLGSGIVWGEGKCLHPRASLHLYLELAGPSSSCRAQG